MSRLWLSLGLVHLFASIGVFVEQVVHYGIWWEWDEFFHHEDFIAILFYASIIFLAVALVNHTRRAK